MVVQLEQVLGTWRHTNGNIIIDFNIRSKNFGEEVTKAMFTIYQRELIIKFIMNGMAK